MNRLWKISLLRSRYALAIVAGLLLAASFPNVGIAGFAWVAPGLMVATALGTRSGESFRLGYLAGLAHYLAMLYWLLLIPYRWHGIPLGPVLGWLSLSAFLALFPATWVWLVAPVRRFEGRDKQKDHPASNVGVEALKEALSGNWIFRGVWALSGAAIWVGLEMFLARVFGGFPWDLLGVSQYHMTPLIQISSVTGVYGVSFLVVWISLSLVSAGVMVIRRPTARSVWVPEVFVPVIAVAILFNLGFRQLRRQAAPARTLKATLLQPSIPQTLIWDPSNDADRFHELIRLSEQALTNQTDLLIWPEAAVPKLLRYDQETFEQVTSLARRHHIWMIVGSDDAEPRRDASNRNEADYFNSGFLLSPEGKLVERYLKRNLVIFGEYVPLQHWLPFLKYFTPIEGGFTPGRRPVPFDLDTLKARAQVLICFEDVFPHLARKDVAPGTDFLVNLTNDGWFGESAAQWQQAATGLFRAVENHVPLIRCANNGLTCWVDARGVLRDVFRDAGGSEYGKGFMTAEIPMPSPGAQKPLTFYTRHGDWFGWGCVGIAVLLLARRVTSIKRASPQGV